MTGFSWLQQNGKPIYVLFVWKTPLLLAKIRITKHALCKRKFIRVDGSTCVYVFRFNDRLSHILNKLRVDGAVYRHKSLVIFIVAISQLDWLLKLFFLQLVSHLTWLNRAIQDHEARACMRLAYVLPYPPPPPRGKTEGRERLRIAGTNRVIWRQRNLCKLFEQRKFNKGK